jgi:glycerol-3-phosphate dehydrogenase (NAD(P)+)
MRIAILGAGNMGTALAVVAAQRCRVVLWSIEESVVRDIQRRHSNKKYLPGVRLHKDRISATEDITEACQDADGVIVSVPSTVIADVAKGVRRHVPKGAQILCVAKGIDPKRFQPLPYVVARALGRRRDAVAGLAGPAIATEFARGAVTGVVCVGAPHTTSFWSGVLQRSTFRVHESQDLRGASWASALKNVYSIVLGMSDGMQLATNTKALLVERCLDEMAYILDHVRADSDTAYGLAGIGDLLVSGFSPNARNRRFGEMICEDEACDIPSVLETMTVEGVAASSAVHRWARVKRLQLPLVELVWRVCHRKADPCVLLDRYLRSV